MKKKLIIKVLTILDILLFITYLSIDIESQDKYVNDKITVEIRGEVENPGLYELDKGSNYHDLFDIVKLNKDADTSDISLQNILYNRQLIVIDKKKEEKLISINSADLNELCQLPGIGEKTAQKIIDYRNDVGSFLTLDQLKEVSGIGDVKFNKIKLYICL